MTAQGRPDVTLNGAFGGPRDEGVVRLAIRQPASTAAQEKVAGLDGVLGQLPGGTTGISCSAGAASELNRSEHPPCSCVPRSQPPFCCEG